MKTARERAEEILCRIYGDDWKECYDVTGHDLLTPTIELIELDRQEQREACAEAFEVAEDSDLPGEYDKWLNEVKYAILAAGKEE